MKDKAIGARAESARCESCGSGSTFVTLETERFPYGDGAERVELKAQIPVVTCRDCGESFAAIGAEDARHDAVCRHLGRLTPNDIRGIRERYGLSQLAFAYLTGFGPASIKRWEAGALIQSESADKFIRLLRFVENVHRLKNKVDQPALPHQQNNFRTPISEISRRRAATFRLSPSCVTENQAAI